MQKQKLKREEIYEKKNCLSQFTALEAEITKWVIRMPCDIIKFEYEEAESGKICGKEKYERNCRMENNAIRLRTDHIASFFFTFLFKPSIFHWPKTKKEFQAMMNSRRILGS